MSTSRGWYGSVELDEGKHATATGLSKESTFRRIAVHCRASDGVAAR
jgi:hypothetical protein